MTRRRGLAGLAAGLVLVAATAAVSVAGVELPHPAHIHSGLCSAPGEVLAPLSDVTEDLLVDGAVGGGLPVGAASATAVQGSVSTVPLSLSDLVAADHSIDVHAGPTDPQPIACGDIGGRAIDGTDLAVGIGPVGESGLGGIAWLSDQGDGSTVVRLFVTASAGAVPSPSTSPSAAPSAPAAQTVSLAGSLYFAGLQIDVSSATHDPVAGTVVIEATITNLATVQRSLLELQVDRNSVLAWGTQTYPLEYQASGGLPPTSTIDVRIVAGVPPDFVLSESVLTFGQPIHHQALLPLVEGATGESLQPVTITATGRAVHRGVLTVRMHEAQVVAAACSGRPDAIWFGPLRSDQMSLLVRVTERSGPNGTTVNSFATGPGRISAQGTPGGTSLMGPRLTLPDGLYCYTLPSPLQGEYTITITSGGGSIPSRDLKLRITVP